MNNTIQTTLPPKLYQQVHSLVSDGWFKDESDLFYEALRRFLDTHRPELMESYIREDIEWGLRGED